MSANLSSQPFKPEVWGGIECTINRLGNEFRDQLFYAGHYDRPYDMDMIASLGISKLRYPILWERHQCEENRTIDWRWTEARLAQIHDNGITPIAGLVHHGSGPRFTDLLDPDFPEKLARYAGLVASKFPWIKYFTPVNEPLTTARFSTLYGHWYPHKKSPKAFAKALINQVKGVVLAMKAIRNINPAAMLIQTEDLACVHSTERLSYQAEFENERRWLTFDLLSGMVTESHHLWKYFIDAGIEPTDLEFFLENVCTPDILGLNYYVTSERYLDENINAYAHHLKGGNNIHEYVDVEAVRMGKIAGIEALLMETWNRYQQPMAMTEVHIGCTVDEQIRWFMEMWNAACNCRAQGIPLHAVTAWSLLGAYDWDSLLTKSDMHYECGAFEVCNGEVCLTELGKAIATVAATGHLDHPVLSSKGWWQPRAEETVNAFG